MPPTDPPTPALRVSAAGDTHVGGRAFNEDAILLRPDLSLFVAADGAGGHNAGNVASALATSTIAHYFEETRLEASAAERFDALGLPMAARRLATAVHRANQEVLAAQKASERQRGMGTTVVAAMPCLQDHVVHLAHVGDSRCYRLRDDRLEQLTVDHTLVNDVLELSPAIEDALAAELPTNVTTRALGMTVRPRVCMRTLPLAAGDRYLLCTDGLTRVLDDDEIWEELVEGGAADQQVQRLIARAMSSTPRDNLAVLVLHCEPATEPDDAVVDLLESKRPPRVRARRRTLQGPKTDEPSSAEQAPEIEIIMVDANLMPVRDSSPDIHVVPAKNVSDNMLRALHGVVVPMLPKPRHPAATMPHIDVDRCIHCNELIERATQWCPHCGKEARGL